jgi:hypothetical protein
MGTCLKSELINLNLSRFKRNVISRLLVNSKANRNIPFLNIDDAAVTPKLYIRKIGIYFQ